MKLVNLTPICRVNEDRTVYLVEMTEEEMRNLLHGHKKHLLARDVVNMLHQIEMQRGEGKASEEGNVS